MGFLIISCVKEPCYDAATFNENNEMTQKWFVPDSISTNTIKDENGISQTLSQFGKDVWKIDGVVEDDCGAFYDGVRFSIQYSTSVQPYHFSIDITSGGANEDDFYIHMNLGRIDTDFNRIVTYNFIQKRVVEGNAELEELTNVLIGDNLYGHVLKITLLGSLEPNDLETVLYAQGYGLIQIAAKEGAVYTVQNPQ